MWRPGDGFYCPLVFLERLQWHRRVLVPHQQLEVEIVTNEQLSTIKSQLKINEQNSTLLSLSPEASSLRSEFHFKPHTSRLCAFSRLTDCSGLVRVSLWRIVQSQLPEDNWSEFHAKTPVDKRRQNIMYFYFLFFSFLTLAGEANAHTNSVPVSLPYTDLLSSSSVPDLNISSVSPHCHKVSLKIFQSWKTEFIKESKQNKKMNVYRTLWQMNVSQKSQTRQVKKTKKQNQSSVSYTFVPFQSKRQMWPSLPPVKDHRVLQPKENTFKLELKDEKKKS